jgi:hypothetical protein
MMNTSRLGLIVACAMLPSLACAHPPVRPPWQLPYGVQVDILDEDGSVLPTADRSARRYILGGHGGRYTIRVSNPSSRRVEVVVSVDGLDVIDGKPASLDKRGYVINPWSDVRIDGWRTTVHSVAAFRFGRVADSYAARTSGARNVGVIGVALFTERDVPPPPRPIIPRRHYHDEEGDAGGVGGARGHAEAAPRAPARSANSKAGQGATAAPDAAAPAERRRAELQDRPGLGTEFGEQRGSSVTFTTFVRASTRPAAYAELRYNDQAGLARLGIHFDHDHHHDGDDLWLRESAKPFPVGRRFASPPPPHDSE